jgi:hypothetical protein
MIEILGVNEGREFEAAIHLRKKILEVWPDIAQSKIDHFPEHFRSSDVPLLVRYVESIVLADRAAVELRKGAVVKGKTSPWLAIQREAIKAMVALSIRLRLSPQSRIDPKTLGRQQLRRGPAPWEL